MPKYKVLRERLDPDGVYDPSSIAVNPWDKAYWFARMLIASDEYGGVGKDTKLMNTLASAIQAGIEQVKGERDEEAVEILARTVEKTLLHGRRKGTKIRKQIISLVDDLADDLLTIRDFQVLALTCEKILIPINESLVVIPSDDRVFAESIAEALLETKGEAGLANVINVWDEVGAYGSMKAERIQVVEKFGQVREHLDAMGLDRVEKDVFLTAFCQEFERRLGQKRKRRAGRGVESVTTFILEYFGIPAASEPEHFTTGLEIDRWVRTKDKWLIGISCKRTLRERWKQAYTTDIDLLNRHKIKALWHVLTFDRDLSDDKLTEMGSYRAVVYLPDDSPRYRSASQHPGMRDYVRPMSHFIKDLKHQMS